MLTFSAASSVSCRRAAFISVAIEVGHHREYPTTQVEAAPLAATGQRLGHTVLQQVLAFGIGLCKAARIAPHDRQEGQKLALESFRGGMAHISLMALRRARPH